MKILIGTTNKCKIEGARVAFDAFFSDVEINGVDVNSGVFSEPVNDDVYNGARNRALKVEEYALKKGIKADYYLGIEAGIINLFGSWFIIHAAVIKSNDGHISTGISSGFPVPDNLVSNIINSDLHQVIKKLSLNDTSNGTVSILTHEVIKRVDLVRDAFIMALTSFINDYWK